MFTHTQTHTHTHTHTHTPAYLIVSSRSKETHSKQQQGLLEYSGPELESLFIPAVPEETIPDLNLSGPFGNYVEI